MRNIILYLLLCIGLLSCKKEETTVFNIKGHIENISDSLDISIVYPILKDGVWVTNTEESKVSASGDFQFSGNVEGLTKTSLYWGDEFIYFLLEPENIELNIDNNQPYSYHISGTKTTFESLKGYEDLLSNERQRYESLAPILKLTKLYNEYPQKSSQRDSISACIEKLLPARGKLYNDVINIYLSLIEGNRDSKIAPILLYEVAISDLISRDSINKTFNSLPKESQESWMGRFMKKKIENMSPNIVEKEGDLAVDFERKDVNGKPIKLHDYKSSKYVLLDFWASWCGPCIAGMPTVASLCDEYKQEDLIIIGISCDEDREAWKNAISKYNLNQWIQIKSKSDQVVENAIFNENIADWYKVQAIPSYFFINKEGVVLKIWSHIGKDELEYIKEQINK